MKFYDKNLTPAFENIKQVIVLLIVFTIGFVVGYFACNYERQNANENIKNEQNIACVELAPNTCA